MSSSHSMSGVEHSTITVFTRNVQHSKLIKFMNVLFSVMCTCFYIYLSIENIIDALIFFVGEVIKLGKAMRDLFIFRLVGQNSGYLRQGSN